MTHYPVFPFTRFYSRMLALFAVLACLAAPAFAADDKPAAAKDDKSKDEPQEETVVTEHKLKVGGKTIHYKATTGTITIKAEDKGKTQPKASVFYIAYTRTDDKATTAARPVTFSFNGGPGSSSVWLHLGVLGPRRVALGEDGQAPVPPFKLVDNEFSLLDQTDLVFIDPVSTGFSRPAPGEDPGQFHGVDEDVRSVGEFIRVWTTRNGRWGSPKFLIGESYGTTRAAGLTGRLQRDLGMYLNGVMLISTVLDFQTISFTANNQLPYILFLPSYTATAWYHKRLPADLQARPLESVMDEARRFATGEYAAALVAGDAQSAAQQQAVAEHYARLTGLGTQFVRENNLRVSIWRFSKELLRDERRTVGRFDSRYTGIDRDAAGEGPDYDPSFSALQGVFTATMNAYLRDELKFHSDLPYEILTGNVQPWKWGGGENQFLDVAETLREAVTYNPHLRVFVGAGRYDLATPWLASLYTVDHLGLDPTLRGNITVENYDAGHMMYVHPASLEKMKADLARFITAATPAPHD